MQATDEWFDPTFDPEDPAFFEEDEEEDPPRTAPKWITRTIVIIMALALLSNVLAFWPQVYSLQTFQFLKTNYLLSQNEQIQEYKKAVVVVRTTEGKGTGFNIKPNGIIITNDHVVEGEQTAMVRFPSKQTYSAEVIFRDPSIDTAFLKIQDEVSDLPTLQIGDDWQAGMPIYVIGNPTFFSHIANEGTILGLTALQGWNQPVLVLQAPIFKGNSGSPVLNEDGVVIGVVFATIQLRIDDKSEKVGLAVPTHDLLEYLLFIEEMMDPVQSTSPDA